MDGRPPGLVLDLGDPRRRGVDRPEPVEPEPERAEHHDARHDSVADQHERLPPVCLPKLLDARRDALGDGREAVAARQLAEVRR